MILSGRVGKKPTYCPNTLFFQVCSMIRHLGSYFGGLWWSDECREKLTILLASAPGNRKDRAPGVKPGNLQVNSECDFFWCRMYFRIFFFGPVSNYTQFTYLNFTKGIKKINQRYYALITLTITIVQNDHVGLFGIWKNRHRASHWLCQHECNQHGSIALLGDDKLKLQNFRHFLFIIQEMFPK